MQNLPNAPKPKLHVFVCVNDRTQRRPGMPSCAPSITMETVKQVKYWIMQQGLTHKVLITKTGCLGICPKNGAVLVIYPMQRWVTEIKSADDIVSVIKEELKKLK
ncbi:(2Fe-2S) ferredoxin domain-containing protein [archaeon]|jgi:(2Fe-2S) ferredoxin|nr:(2Fe-2S) ferredoxin domain-containing protein [archaeon]MBT6761857.1 (2Fe-2S) ferredoxin domain-containing protein [archaeon]